MTQVKPAKAEVIATDSLQNLITGAGVSGFDKTRGSHFQDVDLSYYELESAYSSDWLSGKVCDVPPFDMTRAWRSFFGGMDEAQLAAYKKAEIAFKLMEKTREALVLARIYGGAGIVMNVDDGQEPWEPLNLDGIKKGGLRWLVVSDSQFLKAANIEHDPFDHNYGFPRHYRMAPSSVLIHHSRVIRFEGVPLPLAARRRNQYWGKSIIERLYEALINAASIQANIGVLVHEASVDVIKVPDLMEKVSTNEQTKAMQKRFGFAKLQKSVNRLLLLDSEEEFEIHQQNFAGLKDMMQGYLNIVAGAADVPITRLLGQSPGGLSSTGESDIRNYYDFISGQQETMLRPKIDRIDDVLYRSVFGAAPPEDDALIYHFDSLWQLTAEEKATAEMNQANRDAIYLDRGVITEAIVAKQLLANHTYNGIDLHYVQTLEDEPLDDHGDGDKGDNKDVDGKNENKNSTEGTAHNSNGSEHDDSGDSGTGNGRDGGDGR